MHSAHNATQVLPGALRGWFTPRARAVPRAPNVLSCPAPLKPGRRVANSLCTAEPEAEVEAEPGTLGRGSCWPPASAALSPWQGCRPQNSISTLDPWHCCPPAEAGG